MPRKLKVFRTSIGFRDAFVAAPSQKAALAAWGADSDLFARGMAEEVKHPDLIAQPLEKPGEVLTVSRGGLEAHLQALKSAKPAKKASAAAPATMRPAKKTPKRKRPPHRRDKLDAAEAALAEAEECYGKELAQLEKARDAAEEALRAHQAKAEKELSALRRKRDAAREAYQDALDRIISNQD